MARRSFEETDVRSLTKSSGGRSYTVTIPLEYVKELNWRSKQKLSVKLQKDRIVIKDFKK